MAEEDHPPPGEEAHPPAIAGAHPPAVGAVALKIPPFWPADPRLWFAQVEAQFTTKHITTQQTRFDYVVASLSPEFATEVRDLILSPPRDKPYDALKTQLVKRTSASAQRRLHLLFHSEELGDRKPTQLLRRMRQLMGDDSSATAPNNTLFRELFLQRLPNNVRAILATSDEDGTIDQLADTADKIMEVTARSVSSVTNPPAPTSPGMAQLQEEMADLQKLVASLQVPQRARHRHSEPRTRSNYRPPHNGSPMNDDRGYCWYHANFKAEAKKCTPPCSWPGNARAKC